MLSVLPLIKKYGFLIAFPPVYWQGSYKHLTEPELLRDEGLMLTGNLKNPLPFPKSSLSKPKANTQTQGGERVGVFRLLLPGNSLESHIDDFQEVREFTALHIFPFPL